MPRVGIVPEVVLPPRSFTATLDGTYQYTTDAGVTLRLDPVRDRFTIRYLSNTGGRRGTNETRLLNYEIATRLDSMDGMRVTAGGGIGPEQYIPPICSTGTTAGCSYPDISGIYNGQPVYVQTVDLTSAGVPTQRELDAIDRIQEQVPNSIVIAVPKGATSEQVSSAISESLQ